MMMMCGFLSSGDGDGLVFLLSFFALLSYLLFSHHYHYFFQPAISVTLYVVLILTDAHA